MLSLPGVVKVAQRNATVFRSADADAHRALACATGIVTGIRGERGMDGDRAVLDFYLGSCDHYIANCPFGGSTFSWNVHNARLGRLSIHGRMAVGSCDKHGGEYPVVEVAAAAIVFVLIVFAVGAILRRASLVSIAEGKKDTRLCLCEGPH